MNEDMNDEVMPSGTPLADKTQTEVYPDKSYKHIANAKHLHYISLDNDAWSAVAFRRYQRRESAINKDSAYVDVWKITDNVDMTQTEEQVVDHSTEIEWGDDTHAKFFIDGQLLEEPCTLKVQWSWQNGSTPRSSRKAVLYYRAEAFMPTYCDLSEDEQELAQSILNKFSLLRDNHYGNGMPNLAEDAQTSYSLEDVAMEMQLALSRINMTAIQMTSFVIGSDKGARFPKVFYNYLMTMTMIGLVKKFIIGYVETPAINGSTGVAYADRRDYVNRWQSLLQSLESDAKALDGAYKRATLNLTASSVLVGGGLFGSSSGMFSNRMVTAISRGWQDAFYLPVDTTSVSTN